jgi:hypothetical protein
MSKHDCEEQESTEALITDAVAGERADVNARTEWASIGLPTVREVTIELRVRTDGELFLFLDAGSEIEDVPYAGATVELSPEAATELGYDLIEMGRVAKQREESDQ